MVKLLVLAILSTWIGLLFSISHTPNDDIDDLIDLNQSVNSYLKSIGQPTPNHFIEDIDSAKAKQGEDLVTIGYTRKEGINTRRISKHFVCINCHNVVPENQNLINTDPEIRLDYMMKNKLPFLPATTLYGAVNRTSFFNDDYAIQYGQLALNAKDTLKNAIQLCANVVSQGRELEKWELEAILHYLNLIQIKMKDLDLSSDDLNILKGENNAKKGQLIQSKYPHRLSATIGFPQTPQIRQKGAKGDWEKGEYIFKYGCMHCHNPEGITVFTLESDQFNRNFLSTRLDKTNNRSIYEITRKGTRPKKLKKSYMPAYTFERLSELQLEHLAAYVNYNPKNQKQ